MPCISIFGKNNVCIMRYRLIFYTCKTTKPDNIPCFLWSSVLTPAYGQYINNDRLEKNQSWSLGILCPERTWERERERGGDRDRVDRNRELFTKMGKSMLYTGMTIPFVVPMHRSPDLTKWRDNKIMKQSISLILKPLSNNVTEDIGGSLDSICVSTAIYAHHYVCISICDCV